MPLRCSNGRNSGTRVSVAICLASRRAARHAKNFVGKAEGLARAVGLAGVLVFFGNGSAGRAWFGNTNNARQYPISLRGGNRWLVGIVMTFSVDKRHSIGLLFFRQPHRAGVGIRRGVAGQDIRCACSAGLRGSNGGFVRSG